jgi:membrane protease YdiL (CAAX protease family)
MYNIDMNDFDFNDLNNNNNSRDENNKMDFDSLFKEVKPPKEDKAISSNKGLIIFLGYFVINLVLTLVVGFIPGMSKIVSSTTNTIEIVANSDYAIGIINNTSDNVLAINNLDSLYIMIDLPQSSPYLIFYNSTKFESTDDYIIYSPELYSAIVKGRDYQYSSETKLYYPDSLIELSSIIQTSPSIVKTSLSLVTSTFGFFLSQYLFMISCLVLIFVIISREVLDDFIDFKLNFIKKKHHITVAASFGIVFAVNMLASIVIVILSALFNYNAPTSENQATLDFYMTGGVSNILLTIGFAVIIGPLVEEIVFRTAAFAMFKKFGTKAQIILSGVIFGLIHLTEEIINLDLKPLFFNGISYIGMGIAFGYLYHRNKQSITINYIAHALWNLLSIIITITLAIIL